MSVRAGSAVRRARSVLVAGALALLVAAWLPDAALAHGLAGRADLPIPRWLFAWATALVLVLSFVALSVLWPQARLEAARSRPLLRVPRALDPLCGAIGVAVFVLVVYAGFAGEQDDPLSNLAPIFVFVLFWVGLPFASALLGDVFRPFNPWRAIARAGAWLGRRAGIEVEAPRPYPSWLGRWPAALTILGFAWLELVYVDRDRPSTLAALALGYAVVQFVAMCVWGIDEWERRGDGFAVLFGLFGRLGPLDWREGRLRARVPLSGLTEIEAVPGTVALLCVAIGSTSFDGLSFGPTWLKLLPHLQSAFGHLGFGPEAAGEVAGSVGLVVMVLAIAALFRIGIAGMRSLDTGLDARELAGRFVFSLVPIAFAYVVAHYFSLLAENSQAVAYLISDPLGVGSDLFGTARATIDYGIVSPSAIWYVQVAALLAGHVSGLVLAHDRALVVFRRPADASRSQYWMLAVMVGYTCLGLWLLSEAA